MSSTSQSKHFKSEVHKKHFKIHSSKSLAEVFTRSEINPDIHLELNKLDINPVIIIISPEIIPSSAISLENGLSRILRCQSYPLMTKKLTYCSENS